MTKIIISQEWDNVETAVKLITNNSKSEVELIEYGKNDSMIFECDEPNILDCKSLYYQELKKRILPEYEERLYSMYVEADEECIFTELFQNILLNFGWMYFTDWNRFSDLDETLFFLDELLKKHVLEPLSDVEVEEIKKKIDAILTQPYRREKLDKSVFETALQIEKLVEKRGFMIIYYTVECDCLNLFIVTPQAYEKLKHIKIYAGDGDYYSFATTSEVFNSK